MTPDPRQLVAELVVQAIAAGDLTPAAWARERDAQLYGLVPDVGRADGPVRPVQRDVHLRARKAGARA